MAQQQTQTQQLATLLTSLLNVTITTSQLRHTLPLQPIHTQLLTLIFDPVPIPENALELLQYKQDEETIDMSIALQGEERQTLMEQIEFLARNFESCRTRAYVLRFLSPMGGEAGKQKIHSQSQQVKRLDNITDQDGHAIANNNSIIRSRRIIKRACVSSGTIQASAPSLREAKE